MSSQKVPSRGGFLVVRVRCEARNGIGGLKFRDQLDSTRLARLDSTAGHDRKLNDVVMMMMDG